MKGGNKLTGRGAKGQPLNTLAMDVTQLRTSINTFTKDQILEDIAQLYATAQMIEINGKLSPKRIIKMYKKAILAPAFSDEFIPVTNEREGDLFKVLLRLRDCTIAMSEILYTEMGFDLEEVKKEIEAKT